MPCMKLISASAGARRGVPAVAGESILLLCPGAPGCTMGALPVVELGCWSDAVAAPRKSRAAEIRQTRSAMSNYTTWHFAGSNHKSDADQTRGLGRPGWIWARQ